MVSGVMRVVIGVLIFFIFFCVLVLIDLIGNMLVIIVVVSNCYMYILVNCFFVNLVLVDVLIGLVIFL